MRTINLKVNGEQVVRDVSDNCLLVDFLRTYLQLTGTKISCEVGVCGACTVLLDDLPVSSCITLATQANGREITTIEGLADGDGLHPVQQAFITSGGYQCGICTPGQVLAAKALLATNANPTKAEIEHWMMGNLCRCTGYYKILESIQTAAKGG